MRRHREAIALLVASGLFFGAASCAKKNVEANGTGTSSTPSSAASSTAASSSAAPNPGAAAARSRASQIAENCALPTPAAPKSPGAPDAAFEKKLAAALKCDASSITCDAGDAAASDAKAAVSSDNKVPPGILAACIAHLDDASPMVRKAAADCIDAVGYSIPDPGPAIVALLGKLEAQKPEDSDVALHYAMALEKLNAGEAGYTCRVLRLLEKLPKDAAYASDVLATLYGMGSKATDVAFDYAYERVMSDDGSPVSTRAMELIRTATPPTRESVRCDKVQNIMKAGARGWGEASMVLREEACNHLDLVVATAVKKLRFIEQATSEKTIENPLLDAAFVSDLPTWPGVTADQKKAFCEAAKALASSAKTDDAKAFGKKALASCP